MRTETRTVRVGENVGPVDWGYDFRSHFDSMGTSDARKDEACERAKAWLRRIEADVNAGVPIRATTYGGWPRCAVHRVVEVGMYDGWPYWRPVPSVALAGHYGVEWHAFSSLTDVYPGETGWDTLAKAPAPSPEERADGE